MTVRHNETSNFQNLWDIPIPDLCPVLQEMPGTVRRGAEGGVMRSSRRRSGGKILGWGFVVLVACLAVADGAASNLRVGTCDTAVPPYILIAEDLSLSGFEPQLWVELYKKLSDEVSEGTDSELKLLVGTTAPTIQLMPLADLKAAVISNQLDIAFCGLELTADAVFLYDHSASFHERVLQVGPQQSSLVCTTTAPGT